MGSLLGKKSIKQQESPASLWLHPTPHLELRQFAKYQLKTCKLGLVSAQQLLHPWKPVRDAEFGHTGSAKQCDPPQGRSGNRFRNDHAWGELLVAT